MKQQSVDEFMSFVSALREDPEKALISDGYTRNSVRYPPDNYTMNVWIKDTDGGRLIVAVHDQQLWDINIRYRRWCSEMLQSFRELGHNEAHIRMPGEEML